MAADEFSRPSVCGLGARLQPGKPRGRDEWSLGTTFGSLLLPPLLLMCVGAVYDGYHYVSDAVAGVILGVLAFALECYLLERSAHGVN